MSNFFLGSIDLSKIDTNYIKMVPFKDGTRRPILQISISKRKVPSQFGDTHYISYAPKGTPQDQRNKFICGDLREWQPVVEKPTPEQIEAAPAYNPQEDADLPF